MNGHRLKLIFLIFLIFSPASFAQEGTKPIPLKKVVAIGYVDTGYLGFQQLEPDELSEMFRVRMKKELEKKGYAPVLAELGPAQTPTEIKVPELPKEIEDPQKLTLKDMQKIQAQIQQQMSQLQGYFRPQHRPVAAQALFQFSVQTGESYLDSGSVVGWAELFTQSDLSVADFSSESRKFNILITQHDPKSGQLQNQKLTKTSSTRLTRLMGSQFYSVYDSRNHEVTFSRLFGSAVKNAASWIDQKMRNLPWEGEIFKIEGDQIYLNAGSQAGVVPGMSFKVFHREKVTGAGLNLGTQEKPVGKIQVTQVQPNFAIAKIQGGQALPGHILKP